MGPRRTARVRRGSLPALITLATVVTLAGCPAPPASSPRSREPRAARAPAVAPGDAGAPAAPRRDPRLDELARGVAAAVEQAVGEGKLPGCVVVIGRRDGVLLRAAYGARALEPAPLPMTVDTVFDLASLTKPIATASSVMILAERGVLSVDDRASKYLPELASTAKSAITIRQLLTHTAGLVADTPRDDYARGRDEVIRRIAASKPRAAPGARFVYSDAGFLLLEEIVRRVSGEGLEAFARANVFEPLGMRETGFSPGEDLRRRAAPTEQRDGAWIQGEVHDPRAFLLGGVAGHAGVFSTADDLTAFAQAMLGSGELHGRRVFSPATAQAFFARHDVPGAIRALGWDVKSAFSSNRGEGLSRRAFGHGGFTGTSLWIDPELDLFVLFLSNRVHPDGKGAVNPLAGRVASLAAAAVSETRAERLPALSTELGVDVLRSEGFERLRGLRVGLITNASGVARDGARTIDLLAAARAADVRLTTLFSPEHGLGADREGKIDDARDEATGLPVVSLYGDTFAPPPERLDGLDALVFDVQDAGVRFYTYASTMRRAMIAAASRQLAFVVLDRPNPIDGLDVAGPVLLPSASGFVNHHSLPIRHGMTLGELASLFDADLHLGLDLRVVRMRGWRRGDYYDATGLTWSSPSPNLRSVEEAVLYPAIGLLEGTNLSVGRGTEAPFELVGAPFVDGASLAAALERMALPGVAFEAAAFTPRASVYRGVACQGVRVRVTDRALFEPIRAGLAISIALHARYPEFHVDELDKLVVSPKVVEAVKAARPWSEIESIWAGDLAAFKAKREKYLLY